MAEHQVVSAFEPPRLSAAVQPLAGFRQQARTPRPAQDVGKFHFKNGATYEGEYVLAGGPPKPSPTPEPPKKGAPCCVLRRSAASSQLLREGREWPGPQTRGRQGPLVTSARHAGRLPPAAGAKPGGKKEEEAAAPAEPSKKMRHGAGGCRRLLPLPLLRAVPCQPAGCGAGPAAALRAPLAQVAPEHAHVEPLQPLVQQAAAAAESGRRHQAGPCC
jgi:hypothetical protein